MKKSDKIIINKWDRTGLLEGLSDLKKRNVALENYNFAFKLIFTSSNHSCRRILKIILSRRTSLL